MHFTKEPIQLLYLLSYLYTFINICVSRYLSSKLAENSRSEFHLEDKTKLVNFEKAMLCTLNAMHSGDRQHVTFQLATRKSGLPSGNTP